MISISTAAAGCYSGCGYAPVAYYSAPVVYSYSYAAPVTYAAPCSPCGYGSYGYASYGYTAPMYVVNQGPAYTAPVIGVPEATFDYGYRRAYPYYSDGGVRWHRRHWHRGFGQREFGYRRGYRHHGYRYGYRHGVRYGGRRSMYQPMVGPRGMYRGPRRFDVGPRGMYRGPRHFNVGPRYRMGAMPRYRMRAMPQRMGRPGAVHPMGGKYRY
jgi:hypothetical protein